MDRNIILQKINIVNKMSLSARRAWIEMSGHRQAHTSPTRSLSARRAWIEIKALQGFFLCLKVALRKESVDRNTIISQTVSEIIGSLSARRAWIEIGTF